MADVGKPKRGTKGNPDKVTTKNLEEKEAKPVAMNFVVDADFRKEYRIFASENDMSMVEILKESFEMFKNSKQ